MAQLIGILNITPDSFSDGGRHLAAQDAIRHAKQLFTDGAALVDVGAESTRPRATPLTAAQEWDRLGPVLQVLIPRYPGKISLDSYHPQTVRRAFAIGPVIVNDVTGMNNPAMVNTVVSLRATCIISQLPGGDIQKAHRSEPLASAKQVKNDLLAKAALLQSRGLPKNQIILDPGIGFGKAPQLNAELLEFAQLVPDYDVMVGYSRKRFLGEHRMQLAPNLQAGKIAAAAGARYLRVHDVAGHKELIF